MESSKLALLLVLLACVERCLSASCIVDSFMVKEDFDPKRVSKRKHATSTRVDENDTLMSDFVHGSMQGSGMHCKRRTPRACSCRTTSLPSIPSMTMAPWPPPPRDASLSSGKSGEIFELTQLQSKPSWFHWGQPKYSVSRVITSTWCWDSG